MSSLFSELKRRNVFRVGAAYLVVAWLILQVAEVLIPVLELPDATLRIVFFALLIGFAPALIFAWAYEMTPDGLKREEDVDHADVSAVTRGRTLDRLIIGALVVVLSIVVWDSYLSGDPPEITAERSIAVLPFLNMSADPENEYFSDGLSDTLLHKLAQLDELKVTARNSSFQFKGENRDIREIGEQLNVNFVLEGSVQRSGDQIRIIAQLIETDGATHLDSATYNRTLADVFAIQDEIAERVVAMLQVNLLEGEREALQVSGTASVEAYEHYLLGRHQLFGVVNETSMRRAIERFRSAKAIDADYVDAYVGEALGWMHLTEVGGANFTESIEQVRSILAEIEQRNFDHPDLVIIQGWIAWLEQDMDEAERLFALHADQPGAMTHLAYWHGFLLQHRFSFEESISVLQAALESDPLNPLLRSVVAWAKTGLGQFDESMQDQYKILEDFPEFTDAIASIANDYCHISNDLPKCIEWSNRFIDVARTNEMPARNAWIRIAANDLDRATDILDELSMVKEPEVQKSRAALALKRGNIEDAARIAGDAIHSPYQRWDTLLVFSRIGRLLDGGDVEQTIRRYEEALPMLINGRPADQQAFNWSIGHTAYVYFAMSTDYAALLMESGDSGRAEAYLGDVEEFLTAVPRRGFWGYGILDAELAAVRGRTEAALDALEAALQEGWIMDWWFHAKYNPNLARLHDEPRYQALVEEYESAVADQLAAAEEDEN